MHNLIPLPAVEPGALTTAEIDATMAFAEAEKSAATRKAYALDWPISSLGATPAAPRRYRRTQASSRPISRIWPRLAAKPQPSAAGLPP